jgi:hypothetical protein
MEGLGSALDVPTEKPPALGTIKVMLASVVIDQLSFLLCRGAASESVLLLLCSAAVVCGTTEL